MRINKILVLFIIVLLLAGCGKKRVAVSPSKIKSTDDLTKSEGTITCTREAIMQGDGKPSFSYYISYKDDNILVLHSIEKITSNNKELLNQYYEAYSNINDNYKGLEYYDSKIYQTEDSVSRDTTINYDKIDTDKLLEIESSKDNIIVNKKAKLNKWLDLALKFGTTCDED